MAQEGIFQDRPGYIYLLGSPHGHKIGRSNNPSRRISNIKVLLPFDVRLIHLIKARDAVMAEWFLHQLYSDQQIRGEWFDLTPDDIKFIKTMGDSECFQCLYGLESDIPVIN